MAAPQRRAFHSSPAAGAKKKGEMDREATEKLLAHRQAMKFLNGHLPGDKAHPGGTGSSHGITDGGSELTEEQVEYGKELHKVYVNGLNKRMNAHHVDLQRKADLRSFAIEALPTEKLKNFANIRNYKPALSRVPATWTPPRDISLRLHRT